MAKSGVQGTQALIARFASWGDSIPAAAEDAARAAGALVQERAQGLCPVQALAKDIRLEMRSGREGPAADIVADFAGAADLEFGAAARAKGEGATRGARRERETAAPDPQGKEGAAGESRGNPAGESGRAVPAAAERARGAPQPFLYPALAMNAADAADAIARALKSALGG